MVTFPKSNMTIPNTSLTEQKGFQPHNIVLLVQGVEHTSMWERGEEATPSYDEHERNSVWLQQRNPFPPQIRISSPTPHTTNTRLDQARRLASPWLRLEVA